MEEVPRGKALDRPRDVPGHPSHRLLGNFAYSDLAGLLCGFFESNKKQSSWAGRREATRSLHLVLGGLGTWERNERAGPGLGPPPALPPSVLL